jgi:hypothetical protein
MNSEYHSQIPRGKSSSGFVHNSEGDDMSSISNAIKTTFGLAALEKEAAQNMTPAEWSEYRKINEAFDGEKRFASRQYELTYKDRVAEVRKRLIDEAGSKKKDFVHRLFGQDRFNKEAIDRRAQIEVRNDQQNLIDGLDDQRFEALGQLVENASYRKEAREKPRKDFTRATDRRAGRDRRQRS